MAIDLKNLQGVLKTGRLVGEFDGKRARLITPVFRGSFVKLGKAMPSKLNDRKTWGLSAVFNVGNPSEDAQVSLDSVLLKSAYEVAKAAGADIAVPKQGRAAKAYEDLKGAYGDKIAIAIIKGWVRPGDEDKKISDDGCYLDGYGPGRVFISANTYANDDESNAPEVRDGTGTVIKGSQFRSGYYGRAGLTIYWASKGDGKVCYALESVQLLAQGPVLGGGRTNYGSEFGAVDGAEAFSDAAEPNDFNDDLPF